MRYVGRLTFALLLLAPSAEAQTWQEFADRGLRFHINFPGVPQVDDIAYKDAGGASHPAKQFRVENERGRYSITVVDLTRSPAAEPAASEAALSAIRAKGKPVYDQPANVDGIRGHQIFVDTFEGWKVIGGAFFYNNRLYIPEGASPPGSPPPTQFQQSLMFVDENGKQLVNDRFRNAN